MADSEYIIPYDLKNRKEFKGQKWISINNIEGRKMVAPEILALALEALEKNGKAGNYHSLNVHKKVFSLRCTFSNSLYNTVTTFDQVMPIEGGRVSYQVHGGVVYLLDITILPRQDSRGKAAGLYLVKKEQDKWVGKPKETIDTLHATVNGRANDISHAGGMLRELIPMGHNKGLDNLDNGFTLFYVPDNTLSESVRGLPGVWRRVTGVAKKTDEAMHLATATATATATAMATAGRAGREVNWTVHEDGALTFAGALRVLKQQNVKLDNKQSVFLVNPTSNLIALDLYRRSVEMAYAEKGSHITKALSLRQSYLGGNLVGNIYMARNAQGNTFDKISAGGNAVSALVGSLATYGTISLSAFLTVGVGSLVIPTAVSVAGGGTTALIISKFLSAAGYFVWGSALVGSAGIAANVSKRMDRNVGGPGQSLFGRQLGTGV